MGWFLVALSSAFEVAADVCFKSSGLKAMVFGAGLYLIGTGLWAWSLQHLPLSLAIVVFTVLNLIAATAAGVVLFDETLSTRQIVGLVFAIAGVVLVQSE